MEEKHKILITYVSLPGEVAFNKELKENEKFIWWIINSINKNGLCWASNEYIANKLGLSISTVSKAISNLNKLNYIEIQLKTNAYGGTQRILKTNKDINKIYGYLIDQFNQTEYDEYEFPTSTNVPVGKHDLTRRKVQTYSSESTNVLPYNNSNINIDNKNNKELFSKENNTTSDEVESLQFKQPVASTIQDCETENNNTCKSKTVERTVRDNQVELNKEKLIKKNNTNCLESKNKSVDINNILSFWKNNNLVQHRINSNCVKLAKQHIEKLYKGTLFNNNPDYVELYDRKFSEKEIIESILNFSLATNSLDYQPSPGKYKDYLKKINIDAFFYNPHAVKEKSLFVKYLKKPELIESEKRMVHDNDPEMSELIKHVYINKILGGIKPLEFSVQDMNHFRRASNRYIEWWENNKKNVLTEFGYHGTTILHKRRRVDLLFDALLENVDNTSIINPGWLSSIKMFDDRLVKYCFSQGILKEN